MKPFGIGIDLVAMDAVQRVYEKHRERFAQRILSAKELQLFQKAPQKINFLAGRFCAKEAILKALGCGFKEFGPVFRLLELLPDERGQPHLQCSDLCHDAFATILTAQKEWSVSISHHQHYATAVAMWMEAAEDCSKL